MPYKLSATLKAHTSDVRALSSPTDQLVLSASRDSTAISWQRSSDSLQFAPEVVLKAGSRYVNAVAYIPPTPDSPKGFVVTGGQDAVINVFNLAHPKEDPDFTLIGHLDNICTLDVTAGGTIVSGSWDKTAKVWKNYSLTYDLKGHQQSVWAVLAVEEDQFLTGSADKTIKLWQQHKVIHTYSGHQDAVRGLALLPDIGFASCSNDSEIRVWTLGGDQIYSLSGHTSFVYSLSVLPNGDIVSGGEDRSVRVWKDSECSQIIVHPAISVWAVSSMPNGDIVSGCSDGVVRIFSESEDRWASADELKAYDAQVASQALPTQQVGDVKKSDLPGTEALNVPGKKPGEVKMIKNGELVEAYQWDNLASTWQKIGDVVDAVGSGRKQLYQGKEYDYVFDVDIKDGIPPLKLPYNVSENPFNAAQRFLLANDLPLGYLDQVVQFIEQNTKGVAIGTANEEYVDPFTGASRYRSTDVPAPSQSSQFVDPFTGASRYVSQPQSTQATSSTYQDPFTGSSRYTAGASVPSTPSAPSKILPALKMVTFKQANVSAMQSKLFQFNEALQHEISTSSLAMYPSEAKTITEIFVYLSQTTATPPRPSTPLNASHVEAIIAILDRWPPSQRFPGNRLLVGFCPEAFELSPTSSSSSFDANLLRQRFAEALFRAAEWDSDWTPPLSKARETNMLLVLRTLANSCEDEDKGKRTDADVDMDLDTVWLDKVLEALSQVPYSVLNKTQRVAFVTVLFNISCQGLRGLLDTSIRNRTVSLLDKILEEETEDSEAAYRGLVAFGNLAYAANTDNMPSLSAAQAGEISQCLQSLPVRFAEARVKNVCVEIGELL
ncbi:hypothetical protein D9613_002740 [Agrocybe pediades]|uniref:Phospholipase A-2-activating protein n=1 Tax=Agrocybe pediades TaxID=84607 RepID=A0A8H4QQI4_9AGAR|nr:hypothetical protein D9613_002740 [Agrocybe pediades]